MLKHGSTHTSEPGLVIYLIPLLLPLSWSQVPVSGFKFSGSNFSALMPWLCILGLSLYASDSHL